MIQKETLFRPAPSTQQVLAEANSIANSVLSTAAKPLAAYLLVAAYREMVPQCSIFFKLKRPCALPC